MKIPRRTFLCSCIVFLIGCMKSNPLELHEDYLEMIVDQLDKDVSGVVKSVVFIPAEHLEWPGNSAPQGLASMFATITLDDGACYLVPPQLSTNVEVGQVIRGRVSGELVKTWPIEVLMHRCPPLSPKLRIGT